MSLKNKTRAIYGLMLLCFAALGLLAIDRLSIVSHQSAVMSRVWAPRLLTAEEVINAAQNYRISEGFRVLSATPEMAQQADGDLADNANIVRSKLSDYRKLLLPKESPAAIDNVEALWNGYLASEDEVLALARAGRNEEAVNRFRNSASKFYLLTSALEELAASNLERSKAASATAERIARQSRAFMVGALVLVAGLVFAAVLFFERQVWRTLVQLSALMQRLARGDLAAEVHGVARRDEIGEMTRAVQVFKDNALQVRRLDEEAKTRRAEAEEERRRREEELAALAGQRAQVVTAVGDGLAELSAGHLTCRLNEAFPPEYRKLHDDFNGAVTTLDETMVVISRAADGIRSSTEEISQASDELARRTETQAASLEETAIALEQLTSTVRASAENARLAKQATDSAKADAERSGQVVRNAVAAMGEIERSARQISDIIGVMDEIAFQTNLLALNAGVEAARAGEAGKGFAVVATEVRALAQRSTSAAKEIKALISSSTDQVAAGVGLVGDAGQALEQIAAQVAGINAAIAGIASAAEEQAGGLLHVNNSVSQMDKVTQQNAAMAEESTAACHTLAQEANELARLIGRFQLSQAEATAAPAHPSSRGRAILRSVSSGSRALAQNLEAAIAEEG